MLSRHNTRSAAAAERATSALSPLPLAVVLRIFSLLPPDCRLRCAEVCRGWRAVLRERSLWTTLEVTAACAVSRRWYHRSFDAQLLRCAARAPAGAFCRSR
jgi:hypothetical protein